MKILMIITEKLPVPPVRGGAIQTYVAALAPLLAKRHDLTILGITDETLAEHQTVNGVTYERIPGGSLELYTPGVVAFLSRRNFDLIHIFNRPRLVLPVRKAAPKARLVLSLHNEMFAPEKITGPEALEAIGQLERIITVSDYIGKSVRDLYPDAQPKLKTLYSGVDLKRFVPVWSSAEAKQARVVLRQQHGLAGKKVILFVGRLSPKKGADVLVRAMPELAARHPDAALVLVGSKWYGEDGVSDYVAYVRALAARAPLPVVSTGFVIPDLIAPWFWAGDIFICASQWEEPLARVHYEAMAAGLPIVTTARGGNPEVIRSGVNGVILDRPDDPKAMAGALHPLLADSGLRERMGRAGRVLAEERYGWDRVTREVLDVWEGTR
ncbi:MAG TPA: glycosyltransferase family 4 protein [Symbiobacteriaceae bacterium]|jgi:spore coat protein SA